MSSSGHVEDHVYNPVVCFCLKVRKTYNLVVFFPFFVSKVLLWTGRMPFWQLFQKTSTSTESSQRILNGFKNFSEMFLWTQKMQFLTLWNFSPKVGEFLRTVAEYFSTDMFLWGLRRQIWQRFRKSFAEGPKFFCSKSEFFSQKVQKIL